MDDRLLPSSSTARLKTNVFCYHCSTPSFPQVGSSRENEPQRRNASRPWRAAVTYLVFCGGPRAISHSSSYAAFPLASLGDENVPDIVWQKLQARSHPQAFRTLSKTLPSARTIWGVELFLGCRHEDQYLWVGDASSLLLVDFSPPLASSRCC